MDWKYIIRWSLDITTILSGQHLLEITDNAKNILKTLCRSFAGKAEDATQKYCFVTLSLK